MSELSASDKVCGEDKESNDLRGGINADSTSTFLTASQSTINLVPRKKFQKFIGNKLTTSHYLLPDSHRNYRHQVPTDLFHHTSTSNLPSIQEPSAKQYNSRLTHNKTNESSVQCQPSVCLYQQPSRKYITETFRDPVSEKRSEDKLRVSMDIKFFNVSDPRKSRTHFYLTNSKYMLGQYEPADLSNSKKAVPQRSKQTATSFFGPKSSAKADGPSLDSYQLATNWEGAPERRRQKDSDRDKDRDKEQEKQQKQQKQQNQQNHRECSEMKLQSYLKLLRVCDSSKEQAKQDARSLRVEIASPPSHYLSPKGKSIPHKLKVPDQAFGAANCHAASEKLYTDCSPKASPQKVGTLTKLQARPKDKRNTYISSMRLQPTNEYTDLDCIIPNNGKRQQNPVMEDRRQKMQNLMEDLTLNLNKLVSLKQSSKRVEGALKTVLGYNEKVQQVISGSRASSNDRIHPENLQSSIFNVMYKISADQVMQTLPVDQQTPQNRKSILGELRAPQSKDGGQHQQQHPQSQQEQLGLIFDDLVQKLNYFNRNLLLYLQKKEEEMLVKDKASFCNEIVQIQHQFDDQMHRFQQNSQNFKFLLTTKNNIQYILERKNYMKQQDLVDKLEEGEKSLGKFGRIKSYDQMKSQFINQLSDAVRNYEKMSEFK